MDEPTKVQNTVTGEKGNSKKPGRKKRKVRKRKVVKRVFLNIFKTGFTFLCIGVIVACLLAVAVVNYVVAATADDDNILDLETISQSQTSYIMAQDPETGEWFEYQELIGDANRIWVSYNDIPENLINAIVAIEDREFWEHEGVSVTRTVYAAVNDVFGLTDSSFGASTITQQLVKNLTDDDETDYLRKLREIFRAWGLTQRYSKSMVMEAYLNTIGLSENIAGVQAGAREYFDKDVSELTLAECATIAGITRAPTYYSPIQNPENSLTRRNSVLSQMLETGYITRAEYDEAVAQPLGLNRNTEEKKESAIFNYFSDMVFEDVVSDMMAQYGYTRSEAINYIYNGGLRIYCTVDVTLQNAFEELFETGYDEEGYFTNFTNRSTGRGYKTDLTVYVTEYDENGEPLLDEEGNVVKREELPQLAAISYRPDGSVAAVVGGVGEKGVSLGFNRATDAARQVGSTMKPIAAYALGLDYGLVNWSSMVRDSFAWYRDGNKAGTGAAYDWPRNVSGAPTNQLRPVVWAVAESINTVAVRVGLRVGINEMFEFLQDTLKITTLQDEIDENGNYVSSNDLGPSSLVLGGMTYGISPRELANAYTMFTGEDTYGTFTTSHSYTRVTDSRGSLVMKPEVYTVQAVSEDTGYIMNRMLQTVLYGTNLPSGASPTGRGMAPEGDMLAAGKTGTTNEDTDRWFVGITPYYTTAIWWGYDSNNYEGRGLDIWNRTSGNVPINTWKTLMESVMDTLEYKEFPEQPATVVEAAYCSATGLLRGANCPSSNTGYYSEAHLPEVCNGYHGSPEADLSTEEE